MKHGQRGPSVRNRSEPLFIEFANFDFTKESAEKFFKALEDETASPLKELLIYMRTKNDERFDDTSPLTESEKEYISQELESDRQEFRKLLLILTFVRQNYDFVDQNYDACLESINSFCAEIPIQFTQDKIHFGKLNVALPSPENIDIEGVGWAGFILGLMAIDLGRYLMKNQVTKIKLCRNCKKFFTRRKLGTEYCSEDCHDLYHRKRLGKEYYKEAVTKHRLLKKEKREGR